MPAVVKHQIRKRLGRHRARTAVTLLMAVAVATQGCAMLRRRAAERPPYRKVSPPIAYEMIRDTQGLLILDLRAPEAFHGDTGHIYRAYNIPEDQLPYRLLELSSFREETFLVYCDTAKCSDSGMTVLASSGFENAVLIDGGIDRWISRGFRTVLPAELAGKIQQDREEEKGMPALRQEPAVSTAPVLCPEPHVPVQEPPR